MVDALDLRNAAVSMYLFSKETLSNTITDTNNTFYLKQSFQDTQGHLNKIKVTYLKHKTLNKT